MALVIILEYVSCKYIVYLSQDSNKNLVRNLTDISFSELASLFLKLFDTEAGGGGSGKEDYLVFPTCWCVLLML